MVEVGQWFGIVRGETKYLAQIVTAARFPIVQFTNLAGDVLSQLHQRPMSIPEVTYATAEEAAASISG